MDVLINFIKTTYPEFCTLKVSTGEENTFKACITEVHI